MAPMKKTYLRGLAASWIPEVAMHCLIARTDRKHPSVHNVGSRWTYNAPSMSTVLEQDHCSSDFWNYVWQNRMTNYPWRWTWITRFAIAARSLSSWVGAAWWIRCEIILSEWEFMRRSFAIIFILLELNIQESEYYSEYVTQERVRCNWLCAVPAQRARVLEQASKKFSPIKNWCDKQISSWRYISCHTDKNRYYTWS